MIHSDICESFIFSSTQQSDKYFIYSKDMSDHPMTYKFYTHKEHLQQASCSHWEQHFQTIQNYGDSFQGAFFTGNNNALILHMNDIPLDLSSVDTNERYEFYDKFLPSITYYISQTGISILSQRSDIISNKGNDNVVSVKT